MVTKIYRAKTLLPGERIGPLYSGLLLVAIPEQKLPGQNAVLFVNYKTDTMILTQSDLKSSITSLSFRKKHGPGQYRLHYYEFRPDYDQMEFDFVKVGGDPANALPGLNASAYAKTA